MVIGRAERTLATPEFDEQNDDDDDKKCLGSDVDSVGGRREVRETRLVRGQRSLFNELFPRGSVLRFFFLFRISLLRTSSPSTTL